MVEKKKCDEAKEAGWMSPTRSTRIVTRLVLVAEGESVILGEPRAGTDFLIESGIRKQISA